MRVIDAARETIADVSSASPSSEQKDNLMDMQVVLLPFTSVTNVRIGSGRVYRKLGLSLLSESTSLPRGIRFGHHQSKIGLRSVAPLP